MRFGQARPKHLRHTSSLVAFPHPLLLGTIAQRSISDRQLLTAVDAHPCLLQDGHTICGAEFVTCIVTRLDAMSEIAGGGGDREGTSGAESVQPCIAPRPLSNGRLLGLLGLGLSDTTLRLRLRSSSFKLI